MVRLCIVFIALLMLIPSAVTSQEAARYFPLEQGNTWVYRHTRTVQEGIMIKSALMEETVDTIDTVTVTVNGTISAIGHTYAVLNMDGEDWGEFRVEENNVYRLHTMDGSGDFYEWRIIDLAPSDENPYNMNPDGYYSPRTIETKLLPLGEMTGYTCSIVWDPIHKSEDFFLVEYVGPAQIGLFDAWNFPTSERYELISYHVVQIPVSVNDTEANPDSLRLSCFPNPFNPTTTLSYTLPKSLPVILAVYNVSGQKVTTMVDERQAAGMHTVTFDGTGLASGLYFAWITAGGMVRDREVGTDEVRVRHTPKKTRADIHLPTRAFQCRKTGSVLFLTFFFHRNRVLALK